VEKYIGFAPYQYGELSGPHYIRVLELRGSWNSKQDLECELTMLSLDHWSARFSFEPVSYTWDGQQPGRYLLCEGRKLKITRNCETLLYDLRLPWTRRLWVDAICINQASNEEKETQIPFMAKIYSQCWAVRIWLGSPTASSNLVFSYLWVYYFSQFLPVPKTMKTWI
jgi:hypothetical protein